MDNNTRKLLNLIDDSLIFNEDWLSREARNNRSFNTLRIKETNQLKRHNQEEGKQKIKALLETPFKGQF